MNKEIELRTRLGIHFINTIYGFTEEYANLWLTENIYLSDLVSAVMAEFRYTIRNQK